MRKERLLTLGAAAAFVLFILSLVELFEARFQVGDIYPVYSSLRSDAAGTKAYFESIERLDGISVERRFDPLEDFRGRGTTVFLFGVSPGPLTWYERIADRANRVVITLPVCAASAQETPRVIEGWELTWLCVKKVVGKRPDYYVLTQVGSFWRVIAQDGEGRAIAVERNHRNGSIVVVTDAYAFSNEGLLRNRQTELLTAVLGNNTHVVFDEHHLGLFESEGVVSLARHYRLHGFAAGLLLLAILFIWRNSSSFLPSVAESTDSDEVSGRDTGAGLTSVLRRSISRNEVMLVCAAEWKRSLRGKTPVEVERVEAIAKGEPVESYRAIARLVNERRRR